MKLSRNDPCSCGSGKKYKHCCLNSNYAATELPIDIKAHDGAIDKSMTEGLTAGARRQLTSSLIRCAVNLEAGATDPT